MSELTTEKMLREEVQHILDILPKATPFYNEDFTEALIHTDATVISVTWDGHTSESHVDYYTGFEA